MPRIPAARTRAHAPESPVASNLSVLGEGAVSEATKAKTKAPRSSELETHLLLSVRAAGLPEPVREYKFHPTRKWRIDFCWPGFRLAVEVEGGIYRGGGHTHVKDLKRDMEKSNALTLLGWRLLRFHGDQVRSGEAVEIIKQAMGAR